MKVINKEKVIKCCYCKTELVYTPKDIRTTFFNNMPYILCPICGSKLFMI